jgi:hypothetical protein
MARHLHDTKVYFYDRGNLYNSGRSLHFFRMGYKTGK